VRLHAAHGLVAGFNVNARGFVVDLIWFAHSFSC
jgi:hypothetical protein